MFDPIKKKTNAAHLGVMVCNAIKVTIELPRDKVFRLIENKMLVGYQWQYAIGGQLSGRGAGVLPADWGRGGCGVISW